MPDDLAKILSKSELRDLIEFLARQKRAAGADRLADDDPAPWPRRRGEAGGGRSCYIRIRRRGTSSGYVETRAARKYGVPHSIGQSCPPHHPALERSLEGLDRD